MEPICFTFWREMPVVPHMEMKFCQVKKCILWIPIAPWMNLSFTFNFGICGREEIVLRYILSLPSISVKKIYVIFHKHHRTWNFKSAIPTGFGKKSVKGNILRLYRSHTRPVEKGKNFIDWTLIDMSKLKSNVK